MLRTRTLFSACALGALPILGWAQEATPAEPSAVAAEESVAVDEQARSEAAEQPATSFDRAAAEIHEKLQASVKELEELRAQIAADMLEPSRELNALQRELSQVRAEYQEATKAYEARAVNLLNLEGDIKARREEALYLSESLFGQYVRTFESRLLVAERARYEEPLEAAKLAPENSNLSEKEVYQAQLDLLTASLDRLEDALGGTRFEGKAVGEDGLVDQGTFVVVGPAGYFLDENGVDVGTAEQRINTWEAQSVAFATPEDALLATALINDSQGFVPFDPTLGNAHKIEATQETFLEHVKKGGTVMIPIFAMAGLAFLIALYKFVAFLFIGRPSRKKVRALFAAVAEGDSEGARVQASRINGPVGQMLAVGVAHLREPRELIEEVMYETVLTTRLKLQRMLPFIAICAASAPLMGLLGTVTGIINTFKMITLFGSGDVKALSGGISEALITTKFGLIVAIPSLLLHAFLSRKARNVTSEMETNALAFVNEVSKARTELVPMASPRNSAQASAPQEAVAPDAELVRAQVNEILGTMLGSIAEGGEVSHGKVQARS